MHIQSYIRLLLAGIATPILLASCAIKDDIPYPIIEAAITDFEVQGQCNEDDSGFGSATISKSEGTVDVYVSDTVTLSSVRVLRMKVSNDATIVPAKACIHPDRFPEKGFDRPASTQNTWMDFSSGTATFTLHTYQDYTWKVRVHQVIEREVQMEGQVGDAVIDPVNRNIIVYVDARQDLSAIRVLKFTPGGQHCTVIPDPTLSSTYDFSQAPTFQVRPGNSNYSETWQVFVYHTEAKQVITATAFARCVDATVSGQCPMGSAPNVHYRQQGVTNWTTVPQGKITINGSKFEAELDFLKPGTTYEYMVWNGEVDSEIQSFTTVATQQLENGSFDEWHVEGEGIRALYCPWAEGGNQYWDTGNHGATTVGASNSTNVTEGGRTFANLQSKYIVIKFAAGNIFTGEYIETDGTHGVLNFGRPFSSFPTKMRFDYKYRTSTINRVPSTGWDEAFGTYITRQLFEGLKGQPDSCNVYVALGDWTPVDYKGKSCRYLIRTRPSALHLMDMNDPHLIAFGQMTCGQDVSEWTTENIYIDYRVRNRQPTTIIVVASSSKYGDYFIGGEGSLLQIDNIELLYE